MKASCCLRTILVVLGNWCSEPLLSNFSHAFLGLLALLVQLLLSFCPVCSCLHKLRLLYLARLKDYIPCLGFKNAEKHNMQASVPELRMQQRGCQPHLAQPKDTNMSSDHSKGAPLSQLTYRTHKT